MIRRFLTRIFMVVLIVFCGYNWIQIRALQDQVAQMDQQIHASHAPRQTEADQPEANDWLGKANRHLTNARNALARSDFERAHLELTRSADAIHQETLEPQKRSQTTLAELQRKWSDIQNQADILWRKSRTLDHSQAQ